MKPPPDLIRALIDGPSPVRGVEWHDEVGSTQVLATDAAARGLDEVHVVLADVQTAGRGRHGATWTAPRGTSLLSSWLLRPEVDAGLLPLLPLLAGDALAEAVSRALPGIEVALKWPNDLLVGGHKSAGVLAGALPGGAVALGVGVNVDWRGVQRPAPLAEATSLAEAAGHDVDRWRLFAGFAGVLGRRYEGWRADPRAFLEGYRARCATIGRRVRVSEPVAVDGVAEAVADDGTLVVRTANTVVRLAAGEVAHVR